MFVKKQPEYHRPYETTNNRLSVVTRGLHRFAQLIASLSLFAIIVSHDHSELSLPGALPDDPAREDLSRMIYPSQNDIPWRSHFIMPSDSLERLFGEDWIYVARFNRIDRRHVYPGMTIKTPFNMNDFRHYEPMEKLYPKAKPFKKYILVNITEQWIGAYAYGELVFSMPAATGKRRHETPVGLFRIDAWSKHHTSSIYNTVDGRSRYPMDYALRFHIAQDNIAYWIHARDLSGKPASHGCIGVFDEGMQQRIYNTPFEPVLKDAEKLYEWTLPDGNATNKNKRGPIVEIIGSLPTYRALPPPPPLPSNQDRKRLLWKKI